MPLTPALVEGLGWRSGWLARWSRRRARLVPGMDNRVRGSTPGVENLSQYITSHSGQLSLAIRTRVGAMSTSQRAVMPCGSGLKAGMLREWVTL